jgi:excisionase family DNA binding protein
VLRAASRDHEALEVLREQLDELAHTHGTARLVDSDGQAIEIPACALHALKLVVEGMARGQTITLVAQSSELTTQEAADLLRVSRPHLVKLLDDGVIDHYKVGTHRRVRLDDVLDYRARRASVRRERLDELTRLSEELEGGYR